jgi:Zn-finger nucleic acid-binding protein
VWLDRGELDKIIERESSYAESAAAEEPVRYGYYDYDENDDQLDDRGLSEEQRPRRRRRSLLGELFHFG